MRAARLSVGDAVTVIVLSLAAVLLHGCSSLPDAGSVHEVGVADEKWPEVNSGGAYYDPAPPRPDATASEVVSGFLEAMKAIPIRMNVARQFLASGARDDWKPENQVITYEAISAPEGEEAVRVALSRAGTYDASGAWIGWLPEGHESLNFTVAQEGGQWRITDLPDALVVPSTWFEEQYQRVARYLFDPSGTMLTPEPVFVPRGEQMSTALVSGLVAPVDASLSEVVRSTVPLGLQSGLSVPIDSAGVAEVDLVGDRPELSESGQERLAAQFIWTLRQDPRVRALDLRLRGRPVTGETLPLNGGAAFDPVGSAPDPSVFGIRNGALVRGQLNDLVDVGPLTDEQIRSSWLTLDPSAVTMATVNARRTSVSVGRIDGQGEISRIEGASILRPGWDALGRMWVVDQQRARVRVRDADGTVTEVQAPGLTGARVRQVLVSRDGTRVVALVERDGATVVQVSRVRQGRDGRVLGLTAAQDLWFGDAPEAPIAAIAWQGTAGVAAVSQLNQELAQVQVASVDGAPIEVAEPLLVRGRALGLLGTPAESARVLVETKEGFLDSTTQALVGSPARGERLLTYTG